MQVHKNGPSGISKNKETHMTHLQTTSGSTVMEFPSDRVRIVPPAKDDPRRGLVEVNRHLHQLAVLHAQATRLAADPSLADALKTNSDPKCEFDSHLTESELLALITLIATDMSAASKRALSGVGSPAASQLMSCSENIVTCVIEMTTAYREGAGDQTIGSLEFNVDEYAETAIHYSGRRPGFAIRLVHVGVLIQRFRDLTAKA